MLKKTMLAAMSVALAIGVFAVPAAADPDTSAIEVNAIPGTKIDLCASGEEVSSNFKYGTARRWTSIEPGLQRWVVRIAKAGRCSGRKLASVQFTAELDKNYTLVYWKPGSAVKLRVFENDLSLPAADGATLTMRHTAKAGAIDAYLWQNVPAPAELSPTIAGLKKGQTSPVFSIDVRYTLFTVLPSQRSSKWSAASGSKDLIPGGAYQAIFMGSNQKNMKVKVFGQEGQFIP